MAEQPRCAEWLLGSEHSTENKTDDIPRYGGDLTEGQGSESPKGGHSWRTGPTVGAGGTRAKTKRAGDEAAVRQGPCVQGFLSQDKKPEFHSIFRKRHYRVLYREVV